MKHQRPLWAPWRIEFIRAEKSNECFLCHNQSPATAGDEEELIIFRGEHCFVILNRYPYNSGHLLIAPYRHVGDIVELTDEERYELMDLTVFSKQVLERAMQPDAYNTGMNLGVSAGAGVADHLHQHIIPRWTGDTNFISIIDDIRVVPEALLATADLLRSAGNEL